MYTVTKRIEISASHSLDLPYNSPCTRIHGHNWIITIEIQSNALDCIGMVLDFAHIKKCVKESLDHKNLNDVIDINPTAENIGYFLYVRLVKIISQAKEVYRKAGGSGAWEPEISKIIVQESEGNIACFTP